MSMDFKKALYLWITFFLSLFTGVWMTLIITTAKGEELEMMRALPYVFGFLLSSFVLCIILVKTKLLPRKVR